MFESPSRIQDAGRARQATGWDYLRELDGMAEWLATGPDRSPALHSAMSGMDTFRGPRTVAIWIHNVAAAHTGVRAPERVIEHLDEIARGSRVYGPATAELASEIHARLEILDTLCCIADNYRCALLLKEGAGFTVERTARLMGVSTASLRSILYRARRALAH